MIIEENTIKFLEPYGRGLNMFASDKFLFSHTAVNDIRFEINLKGTYRYYLIYKPTQDISFIKFSIRDSLLKYYHQVEESSFGYFCYFQKESDYILWKLKYNL